MRQHRKFISLLTALILTFGTATPSAARGVVQRGAATTTTNVNTTATSRRAGVDAPARKRGGNTFVRVLTAPFRALGHLLGGGKKRTSDEAKVREQRVEPTLPPQPTDAGAGAAAAATERQQARHEKKDQRRTGGAQEERAANVVVESGEAQVSGRATRQPATPSANIVRPDESRAQPSAGGAWVPFVEGIPKDHLSQGRALLRQGYLNEAIAELSVASTVGPDLIEANNLLGLAYDKRGWHRQAVEAYERALALAPNDPQVLNNLGYSLYLDDQFVAALKRLKQAARYAPGAPAVHNNLGLVEARLGKYDDAFKSFVRAGGEYDARLHMAQLLKSVGRDRDAIRHYEAALRIQPDAAAVLEHLAELYERTGRPKDAEAARRTLSTTPNKQRTATGGGG